MTAVKEEPAVADGQESKFEQGLFTENRSGSHPHVYCGYNLRPPPCSRDEGSLARF